VIDIRAGHIHKRMRTLPAAVLLQSANVRDLTVDVPRQHVYADALPHFENPSQAGFPPSLSLYGSALVGSAPYLQTYLVSVKLVAAPAILS
jgi:hypothetical protein